VSALARKTLLAFALLAAGALARDTRDTRDVRFETRDVIVDAGSTPLAAWQVEIVDASGRSKLVGLEGGEHAAFAEPAFYDAKALITERVVLAAFQTQRALPVGRTRVARLHLEIQGSEAPRFEVRLVAAATFDGKPIQASALIEH
jgi:hypothetical protein